MASVAFEAMMGKEAMGLVERFLADVLEALTMYTFTYVSASALYFLARGEWPSFGHIIYGPLYYMTGRSAAPAPVRGGGGGTGAYTQCNTRDEAVLYTQCIEDVIPHTPATGNIEIDCALQYCTE